MTKPRDDLVYVGHMLDEARKLHARFDGVARAMFMRTTTHHNAAGFATTVG